ncbi:unnamed protein product, partial [Mesorhabditis belari]|uniref:G-protein coupled receptors family 3 profile domain-containing protein n=1 Tax=Mesorhabditis belari TaxID=2138241 RepID=A0AAF3EA48_9BILA
MGLLVMLHLFGLLGHIFVEGLDFRNVNSRASSPSYVNPYGELRQFLSSTQAPLPYPFSNMHFNFTDQQLLMLGLATEQPQEANQESVNYGLTLGESIGQSLASAHGTSINQHQFGVRPSAEHNPPQEQKWAAAPLESTENTTPFIWTTTKKAPKLSKFATKQEKNGSGQARVKTAAHVSVPSHRLLNDLLVIPSPRRLYILAILPIHQSADSRGLDCGKVDVDGFVRLAAFLDALNQVNSGRSMREAGLSLGAVVIDSCRSDLRTVADLFELLSGTNIHRQDLVALVRDDGSHMPNVDDFAKHLKLPTINTFFSRREQPLSTGTLPPVTTPLEALTSLLAYTHSSCATVVYDDLFADAVTVLSEMSISRGLCIEQKMLLNTAGSAVGSVGSADAVVRKMLLTEARVAIVLLGEGNWLQLMKAFRNEMVIAGRFIIFSIQDPRWQSAKEWATAWPHFDQLLVSVTPRKPAQAMYLHQLAQLFPTFPFPQHWLRQFWSTAFKCHIEGETVPGEQFSKECSHKQQLNITKISPDIDVSPIQIAVHSVAYALRKVVDTVCPGALLSTLNDCLNDPSDAIFSSILGLDFVHNLVEGGVRYNVSTRHRDQPLILNRVLFTSQLELEPIATWDSLNGLQYTSPVELVMEERDGTRVPLRSICPKSACSTERRLRVLSGSIPLVRQSLESVPLVVLAVVAVVTFIVVLMCIYLKAISSHSDIFTSCTIFSFSGLCMLSLVSIFFLMQPNVLSCAVRRIAFSVSLAATIAPLSVKSIFVWLSGLSPTGNAVSRSPSQMFLVSFGLVLIQTVIAVEWAWFESPIALSFATTAKGTAWRCAPGEEFETRMTTSCALPGLMLLLGLFFSLVSIKHSHSRQNVLLCVLSLFFAVSLYLILPLVNFQLRDQVTTAGILLYIYLFLIISFCRGAFSKEDDASQTGTLVGKKSFDSFNEHNNTTYWISRDALMSPTGMTSLQRMPPAIQTNDSLHRPHHLTHDGVTSTLPRPMSAVNGNYTATLMRPNGVIGTIEPTQMRRNSMSMGMQTVGMGPMIHPLPQQRMSQLYGVHGYESEPRSERNEMATMQRAHKSQFQEYVEESGQL